MEKKIIKKQDFEVLERELSIWEAEGMVSSETKNNLIDQYEYSKPLPFLNSLLLLGSFLVGIGILSFVASNWDGLGKWLQLGVLVFFLATFHTSGVLLDEKYPKTARSFHYVGVLLFGASLFLVQQTFHISLGINSQFLMWAVGASVIGFYLRDRPLLIFTTVILFFYVNDTMSSLNLSFPYALLIFLPIFYILRKYMDYGHALSFFINGLAIYAIARFTMEMGYRYDWETYVAMGILFILGIVLLYLPISGHMKLTTELQGNLLHGIMGILLTFNLSFWFVVLYAAFLFYRVNKNSLFALVILSGLIFRYYLDYSFDFLPKSLVFTIGGLLLMALGFLFEKKRKGVTGNVSK